MRRYKKLLCKHSGETPSSRARVCVCVCVRPEKKKQKEKPPTRPPRKDKHALGSVEAWGGRGRGEKKKKKNVNRENAQISARWASSLCVCIHINIQTGLPESRAEQRLFLGEGWEKKKEKRIRGGFWVQLRREAVLFFIFYFFGEVLSVERYEIFSGRLITRPGFGLLHKVAGDFIYLFIYFDFFSFIYLFIHFNNPETIIFDLMDKGKTVRGGYYRRVMVMQ